MNLYNTRMHRWVFEQAAREGVNVLVDPFVDKTWWGPADKTLWIPPGFEDMRFFWEVSKAVVEANFPGHYFRPEDAVKPSATPPRAKPALRLIAGGAR